MAISRGSNFYHIDPPQLLSSISSNLSAIYISTLVAGSRSIQTGLLTGAMVLEGGIESAASVEEWIEAVGEEGEQGGGGRSWRSWCRERVAVEDEDRRSTWFLLTRSHSELQALSRDRRPSIHPFASRAGE